MCRPGHDDLRRGGHRRKASATQPQRGGLRPNGKSKLWGLYIYIHMCVYIYIYLVGFQFVGVSGCLGLRRFGVVSVCHHATIDETGAASGACFVADRCCDLKKPYLGL